MSRKVVLVHGYSDRGASFIPWAKALKARGYSTELIEVVTYKSLTNEVTIKDLAEGFDRALRHKDINGDFDAIVHSTGMLVVRAWLTANRGEEKRERAKRLKHLIGFAPATWGSPLAHRGRGLLGSLFKGNKRKDKENAPDFLEAGDLILDGLELASRFTWDLADEDLFVTDPLYGTHSDTPYPFIFCGNRAYSGLRSLINQDGTDGTVRFAGVNIDSVKFRVDLTKPADRPRLKSVTPNVISSEVVFVDNVNHGTILSEPPAKMVELVDQALKVTTHEEYEAWRTAAKSFSKPPKTVYQQFVIRMMDERRDPIGDYHVELFSVQNGKAKALDFDLDMHAYQADKSFRCFHVEYDQLKKAPGDLWMRVTLSSGTFLVAYRGYSNPGFPGATDRAERDRDFVDTDDQRGLDAEPTELNLNLTPYRDAGIKPDLFFPFTTTLIEVTVDREPLPFGAAIARLCRWEDLSEHELD